MNRDDVLDLLKVITAYDRRTVGETDVLAWGEQARRGSWTRNEALEAVHTHYATSTTMIGPADVNRVVRAARRDRLERAPVSRNPDDRALLARLEALADSKAIDAAPTPALPPAPRDHHGRRRDRAGAVVAAAMARGEQARAARDEAS